MYLYIEAPVLLYTSWFWNRAYFVRLFATEATCASNCFCNRRIGNIHAVLNDYLDMWNFSSVPTTQETLYPLQSLHAQLHHRNGYKTPTAQQFFPFQILLQACLAPAQMHLIRLIVKPGKDQTAMQCISIPAQCYVSFLCIYFIMQKGFFFFQSYYSNSTELIQTVVKFLKM